MAELTVTKLHLMMMMICKLKKGILKDHARIRGQKPKIDIKFIYSEKATKFCKISALFLSLHIVDKSKVEILQNFVAFSEYTNFIKTVVTPKRLVINR